ncbi:co-chaperone GroES [Candidatus Gottesmanbacteria bacterium RBG_16_37_8]|uniref:Co-chaperonin GroES n=1 Tax=Candidatus Gottesmanbacteria bacterium RBG_16_37_8 TaxID=1798371 RepID=A0A1F5YR95_9BACT|nr:MAG: co-chaperone GroES [Candidatus Gottesmanbacteria bacterium RBG_16_37_8]
MSPKTKQNLNIKPLFGNVLIKPQQNEAKTASGIILPDTAQKESQVGIVMAIGPGEVTPKGEKIQMFVKVGQKVMYKKWGGNEVKVNDEEWTMVEQKDILAIVD